MSTFILQTEPSQPSSLHLKFTVGHAPGQTPSGKYVVACEANPDENKFNQTNMTRKMASKSISIHFSILIYSTSPAVNLPVFLSELGKVKIPESRHFVRWPLLIKPLGLTFLHKFHIAPAQVTSLSMTCFLQCVWGIDFGLVAPPLRVQFPCLDGVEDVTVGPLWFQAYRSVLGLTNGKSRPLGSVKVSIPYRCSC